MEFRVRRNMIRNSRGRKKRMGKRRRRKTFIIMRIYGNKSRRNRAPRYSSKAYRRRTTRRRERLLRSLQKLLRGQKVDGRSS